jgi:hypothetical protein
MQATSIQAPASGNTVVQLTVTDDAGRTDTATITLATTTATTTAPAAAGTSSCLSDEPLVTVVATDATASEAGPGTGAFTLSRYGSVVNALTVNVALSGSATNGVDYVTLSGSIVIPAGQRSVVVTLPPIDDNAIEGTETATLAVQAGAGYEVGSPASASVTISDNDPAPSPEESGGGGALDLLTLLAALAAVAWLALQRRRQQQPAGLPGRQQVRRPPALSR